MKVLVVAPAWVGDMVMAHTLGPGLAAAGASVHLLAPPVTAALAPRMPGVAAVHVIHSRHGKLDLAERRAVARRLKGLDFHRAIVLPSSFKSALTPFLAGIPRRTGFRGEFRYALLNDVRGLDTKCLARLVDRFAALADVAPARPRLRADPAARRRLLAAHGLTTGRPVIALCPGAEYGPSKRWPAEHFLELARRCVAAGARVWVLGGASDAAAATTVAAAPAVDLTGKTSLADAVDLLSAATAVVTNDSGLMHVAAALEVPVAVVYGSSSAAFTPPLTRRAVVIERDLHCRPCFARECPLGHTNCLREITPERVFQALEQLNAFAPPARQPERS